MDAFLLQIDTYLQSSIIASLAAAFAGGLLASLTPCIYPMIPITAGVIGHANVGGSRLRGFLLSLVYVTGMALAYAALGVFAAATGRFFGTINSSPWTFLLVGNLIKNQFESTRNWPLGSALSILLVAGTLILIRLYVRVSGRASEGGAP